MLGIDPEEIRCRRERVADQRIGKRDPGTDLNSPLKEFPPESANGAEDFMCIHGRQVNRVTLSRKKNVRRIVDSFAAHGLNAGFRLQAPE
jgi:hypothetical protein